MASDSAGAWTAGLRGRIRDRAATGALWLTTLVCGAVAISKHRAEYPISLVTARPIFDQFRAAAKGATIDIPVVAFLFRVQDCPGALAVIDRLNALDRTGDYRVFGYLIGDSISIPVWREVGRIHGIHVPVALLPPPSAAIVLSALRVSRSPVVILLTPRSKPTILTAQSLAALEQK